MALRLVTLDCANTLLRGAWDPVGFALRAAKETGLALSGAEDAFAYHALLGAFYPEILAVNRTGDVEAVFEVYVRLGRAWLERIGHDPSDAPAVVATSRRLLTAPTSGLFAHFEDTVPFLIEARSRGLRLAVVSNWDATLSLVLAAHGLDGLVDEAYASLVVGAEKPDPTMLRLAMASAGVSPNETLHVGDDPHDDLGAAENAGVQGLLIDRTSGSPLPSGEEGLGVRETHHPSPTTIHNLLEALAWTD